MEFALFLLIAFIILKIVIYFQLQTIQKKVLDSQVCPDGYVGLNSDPFDCNAYYSCPSATKLFCAVNEQFDLDLYKCIPANIDTGCIGRLHRNLLL